MITNDSMNTGNNNNGCSPTNFGFLFSLLALLIGIISIFIIGTQDFLSGVQIQLQGDVTTVAVGDPVIFDTVLNDQSSEISYNDVTGEITITESGLYYINWWVSVDGAAAATTIDLAIVTSAGDTITASSPIVSSQVSGNALLSITATPATPVTVQLINTSTDELFIGATTVRADLTIINTSI